MLRLVAVSFTNFVHSVSSLRLVCGVSSTATAARNRKYLNESTTSSTRKGSFRHRFECLFVSVSVFSVFDKCSSHVLVHWCALFCCSMSHFHNFNYVISHPRNHFGTTTLMLMSVSVHLVQFSENSILKRFHEQCAEAFGMRCVKEFAACARRSCPKCQFIVSFVGNISMDPVRL